MFSLIDVASFTALPLLAAAIVAAVTSRKTARVGLAISVAVFLTLFVLQTRDNHQVVLAQSAGNAKQSGNLWAAAARQTFVQFSLPKVAHHWLPGFVIASLLVTGLLNRFTQPRAIYYAVTAILCGATYARLLWTSVYVQSQWSGFETLLWLGGLGLLTGIVWTRFCLATPGDSRRRLFASGILAACVTITLFCSGSIRYGTMTAVLACAMAGAWLIDWRLDRPIESIAANSWSAPVVFMLATMLILGCAYADLNPIHAWGFLASMILIHVWGNRVPSNPAGQQHSKWWLALAVLPAILAASRSIAIFIESTSSAPVNPYDAYK